MVSMELINTIVNKIKDSCNPEKIVLFGSYAYGNPGESSDLDFLIVVKDSSNPRHKRAREIRKQLWGLTQVAKDILVYTQKEIDEWKNVKEAFITNIMEKGKVLYENKARAD